MHKLIIAAVAFLAVAAQAEAAAQFRHGPDHLGVFDGPAPADTSRQLWRFDTGNRVIASPVISDGVLYIGGMNGVFYALDAKTGREKWHANAGAPISATAAVEGATVFFQTDANVVLALDTATGQERWRHAGSKSVEWHNIPTRPDFSDWDYYASSPLLLNGLVVIGCGDSNVYALDAATGVERWHFQTGSRVRATPAADGRSVFVGGFDGVMVALDLKTGAKKWSFKTAGNKYFPVGEIQSSAAVADGLVIFGSRDGVLYAVDAKTGGEVWKNSHKGSWVISSPAVKDGRVYVGSSDAVFIRAVELKTGKEIWTTPVKTNVFSSPAIAGDNLYAGTFEGALLQLGLSDGKANARLFDERIYSSPWIEAGIVYVSLNDGSVRALVAGP